jgi:fructoselysine-6-P-deglycase FrlB-like protein
LEEATRILKQSEHIYVVGIGSSWNAGLAGLSFFNTAGRSAMLCGASEILHFGTIRKNAAIVFLSRSGKSTEIVQLLGKVASSDTKLIVITNTPDRPLALQADVVLKARSLPVLMTFHRLPSGGVYRQVERRILSLRQIGRVHVPRWLGKSS